MIISVASGKGGTGKTTVAVNLALSINQNIDYLDCDVEEPNSHIFLKPNIEKEKKANVKIPTVNKDKCTFCGRCQEICEYNAIAVIPGKRKNQKKGEILIFPELCHSCGGCSILCPENAISEKDKKIGIVRIGYYNENIRFADGKLDIGQVMSPPLIRAVKSEVNFLCNSRTVIIDAPPGTSCPVIEAVKESNYCILVTEPTPFGLNDLKLAVGLLRKLDINFGVVINKSKDEINIIERFCKIEDIPILLRIPFDSNIAFAYSKGIPIIKELSEYKNFFLNLYKNIKKNIYSI